MPSLGLVDVRFVTCSGFHGDVQGAHCCSCTGSRCAACCSTVRALSRATVSLVVLEMVLTLENQTARSRLYLIVLDVQCD